MIMEYHGLILSRRENIMELRLETMIAIDYLERNHISGVITNVTENYFEFYHEGKRNYVAFSNIL